MVIARDYPEALVMWEAQFGDFANGAQIIIDQFIVVGRGQVGPAHGFGAAVAARARRPGAGAFQRAHRALSATLRARQHAGVQPSTAAQYFHLLRRQALRKWRKPLICFTPKSMLRHPEAQSPLSELERPRFLNVIPDETALDAKRVLLCTGKIAHELRMERKKLKAARAGYHLPRTDVSVP